jgi:N-acetylglucosamine-6-sulfatase
MKYTKLISLALMLGCTTACTQKQEAQKPNILVIMSDDHSSNAISAYGSRLNSVMSTPNLDRIANEGMLLENCFSTNSICTPSRASLLTGQYSNVNKVRTLKDHLDTKQKHLAHQLKEQGYETAIFGKWHLHSEPQGFDQWQVLPSQGLYFDPEFKTKGFDDKTPYASRAMKKIKGYVTDVITDLSLNWLKTRKQDKPFMLMVHQKAPHALWEYHPKYEHLYDGVTIPEPKSLLEDKSHRAQETIVKENSLVRLAKRMSGQIRISSVHDYDEWPTGKLDVAGMSNEEMIKATYQKYLKDYLRVIASVDENVGRILNYLDETGQAENTIVIYTSDQGMFLGEHQYLDKRWIFEESIRMPFLIRWPSQLQAGKKIKELIANVDFAPTILDMVGAKQPGSMQGHSFLPVLKGNTTNWQNSIYYRYWMHRDMIPAHFGIRTEKYKLIFYYGLNLDTNSFGHANSNPAWELYDLEKDPLEMNNVFNDPAYEQIKQDLKKKLDQKRAEVGDTDEEYPELLKIYNL